MAGGNFLATAYGPPWNAMNGSGVTSTGVRLNGQVPIIAVDPNVIPYGSIVRASNSPLGRNRLFVAGDTGGAIRGNHIDFYVASGRQAQMGWGSQQIQLQVVKPGSGPGSVHSALAQLGGMGGPASMGSGGGGSLSLPPATTGTLPALSVQVPTFDQARFDKAQKGYVLGSFLRGQKSPFDTGPKLDTGPSALGALFQKGVLSSQPPNPQDFQGLKSVQIAHQQLQQVAGTSLTFPSAPIGKTGYVNPIPGANIGRTDMGVDANLPAGHPILALGDSRVVGISPNWYRGQPYVLFQLTSGPAKGKFYYVAEAINPTVRPGQMVHAGQVVGTYNAGGTGLELGWGSPTPGRTLAQQQGNTGDASHGNAPAGVSFRNFLGGLH